MYARVIGVGLLLLRAVCSCVVVRVPTFLLAVVVSSLAAPAGAFDEPFKVIEDTSLWNVDNPIIYVLDPAGSDDIDDGSDLDALRAAFRAWSCVPGAKIPFIEGTGPGPREVNLADNKNTLFWDEEGDLCGMGPGTLGIASGGLGGGVRTNSDICFNGRDSEWGVGTKTDVQSIALHEIGHLLGLDHPCSNTDPNDCLPSEKAVMFPQWSGVNDREPRESEIAGVQSLYPLPAGEDSFCGAPFNEFERCACTDECVDGLQCFADQNGELRCGRTCSTDERDCGANGTCVIDAAKDGGGTGLCLRVDGKRPTGAICASDGQCASGTCGAIIALGSSVCLFQCDANSDCDGGTCFDGFCLGSASPVACPVTEDAGCGCTTVTSTSTTTLSLGAVLGGLWVLRRRRRA